MNSYERNSYDRRLRQYQVAVMGLATVVVLLEGELARWQRAANRVEMKAGIIAVYLRQDRADRFFPFHVCTPSSLEHRIQGLEDAIVLQDQRANEYLQAVIESNARDRAVWKEQVRLGKADARIARAKPDRAGYQQ